MKIESAVERAAWLPRSRSAGGLDEAAARGGAAAGAPGAARRPAEPRGPRGRGVRSRSRCTNAARPASLIPAESLLLGLLLRGAEGVDRALEELSDSDCDGLRSAAVLRAAKGLYLRGEAITAASLSTAVEEESRTLLNAVAVSGGPADGVSALDCVLELKRLPLRARMAQIQRALKEAPPEHQEALLLEKGALARAMAALG